MRDKKPTLTSLHFQIGDADDEDDDDNADDDGGGDNVYDDYHNYYDNKPTLTSLHFQIGDDNDNNDDDDECSGVTKMIMIMIIQDFLMR